MGLRKVTLEVVVYDSIEAWEVETAVGVGADESCDDMFMIHSTKIISDELMETVN